MIMPFILFGRKRKPIPEYVSPNTWVDYIGKTKEVFALQDKLIATFTDKQTKLFEKYRVKVLEAERAKPWQNI